MAPSESRHQLARRAALPAPAGESPPSGEAVLDLGRLLVGLAVVALGVIFLLEAAGVIDADRTLEHWWPVVIVAAGAFTLLERPPSVLRGVALILIGGTLLLFTNDILGADSWKYLWPAAMIAAGLVIAWTWQGRAVPRGAHEADVVRSTGVFSGAKVISASRQFRGAWLTAVFGGVTLDLRDALPDPEGASVNATAAFGGIDVIVPPGWRVTVRCIPIFGGVEDKTKHGAALPADAPTLRVDAVALFGGVEIKNAP